MSIFKTQGKVIEIIYPNLFMVELEDKTVVMTRISGKTRMHLDPGIQLGEMIPIERSPYDLTQGRVISSRPWERIFTPYPPNKDDLKTS